MDIRPVGDELFHETGRTDMPKLVVSSANFAKAPNIATDEEHKIFCYMFRSSPIIFRETTLNPSGRSSKHSYNLVTIKDINVCVYINMYIYQYYLFNYYTDRGWTKWKQL